MRIYYIPATNDDAANRVVDAIEAGRIKALPHYFDRAACASSIIESPHTPRYQYRVIEVRREECSNT